MRVCALLLLLPPPPPLLLLGYEARRSSCPWRSLCATETKVPTMDYNHRQHLIRLTWRRTWAWTWSRAGLAT